MSILSGITVIELCEVYQGPLAGQSLGDFGAYPDFGQALRALRVNVDRLKRIALVGEKVEAYPIETKDNRHQSSTPELANMLEQF